MNFLEYCKVGKVELKVRYDFYSESYVVVARYSNDKYKSFSISDEEVRDITNDGKDISNLENFIVDQLNLIEEPINFGL